MGHQNIIELNGKRYDALTGALLGTAHTPIAVPLAPAKPKGKVIDGFIRSPAKSVAAHPPKTTPKHTPAKVSKPLATVKAPVSAVAKAAKPVHRAAAHTKAHQPERAQTLMRHVVAKPKTAMKKAIKVQASAEVAVRPAHAVTAKRSAYRVDARRLEHAQQVARHTAITHFHGGQIVTSATPTATPVVTAPARPMHHAISVPAPVHHQGVHHTPPHRDVFEAAIARANSHQQPKHHDAKRAKRRRTVNVLAGIGAFLVIGGFIGYLNMPNIELRVASFQAGFGAQIPDYTPTGFALRDGVQRTGNTVSMKYQSGDQSYTITQQPSDWNSQTLVDNTLALNGSHKTLHVDGRTVYIYGGNNAVWVDGNVRYDVIGNANLSESDITSLASSL